MEMITNGVWKITLGEPEQFTPVRVMKQDMKSLCSDKQTDAGYLPFGAEQICFRITARGCVVELPINENERFYGFGLQLKSCNQTGKKKHLRTNADPAADSGDSHAPVPFYVSTKGYGVFVDTARYVSFYCGSSKKAGSSARKTEERKAVIADNTEALYATQALAGKSTMLIDIPAAKGVDVYFFAGPDMKTAVSRYNLFCGGGCLPPMWGLGVLYRTYGRADKNKVLEQARMFRENAIPCDCIGLEPGWQSHAYSCSYTWDRERFPEYRDMINELKGMNFRINLWEHVFTHPSSPLYEPLKPYSGDYEVWEGLVPDLNTSEAFELFAGYHGKELVEKGIDGFKLDECDSSDFSGGWSFPNASEFPSGLDGEQMHSLLGLLYQKTILSAVDRSGRRTYGQVRSSHGLASPLPFVLYSDLYDQRDYIRGVVNSGFSGLLWTPEVRQCDSEEELVRRLQTVVFSHQACINAWMIPNPPWLQYDYEKNLRGELHPERQKIQDACRKLLELRMSLIPYLYSSFARYRFEGVPPIRALVMDYPGDSKTYDLEDEYMMGDALLAAPIRAGSNSREVYLPEGNWYCFWENKKYQGNQSYRVEAELDRIPVFVKENTLLPLARPVQSVRPDTCFDISVRCYGRECTDFVLFEDDGESYAYEAGSYNKVRLEFDRAGAHRVIRTGSCDAVKYNILDWIEMI